MYNTGIKACDELNEVLISGNVIPQIWYKTIMKPNLKAKVPYLLAINILAEIVYWYRPTEMRDELTGQVLGYKKKFAGDLLMKSYEELTKTYGYNHTAVKNALSYLESLGVIKREFRTKVISGVRCANIMFLDLNVEVLRQLTYPIENEVEKNNICHTYVAEKTDVDEISCHTPVTEYTDVDEISCHTNTKNTTKNTSYTTQSINQDYIDREIDDIANIVEEELDKNETIPLEYHNNPDKMDTAIRILTDYNIRSTDLDDFMREAYELFADCLGEMCTEKYPRAYHGRKIESGVKFIEKLNHCLMQEGDLYEFVELALMDFSIAAKKKEIKNTRAYMKSVICTALFDCKIKNEALLSRLS